MAPLAALALLSVGIGSATAAQRINVGVAKALAEPDVKERFAGFGFEAWTAPGAALTKAAEADTRRYAEVVKRNNIALD